ncbi:hypothetical protein L3Y34_002267 [Caenorhabditis briggsae]|uniref:Uncharacterized protein n=1 Tax=Caenorhabditis briggsae TaxID=6238 RepID=A0AAE9ISE1_CAEBR|nr:hypothetical protein L3Y34_002267 [Caenorhabditis briggsae]
MHQNRRPPRPSPSLNMGHNNNNNKNSSTKRGELRRFPKICQAHSLPTVPSEDGKDEDLITPVQSQDFDFREIQHRYLMALHREEELESQKTDGTVSILEIATAGHNTRGGGDKKTATTTMVSNTSPPKKIRNIHNLIIKTDDAFFEIDDDDDFSSPSSPPSPTSNTPLITVPLPPKSAPPFPTQPAPTINGDVYPASGTGTPTILSNGTPLGQGRMSPAHSASNLINESRLQQSLSTPCNGSEEEVYGSNSQRKDSEYRRFKSEGSTAGASLPAAEKVHMDELSPVDQRITSGTTRFSLTQQDSVVNPSVITKQSNTEHQMMMAMKTKLSKYQLFVDRAFELISHVPASDEKIIEGCTICIKIMKKAWVTPKVSCDLVNGLCDYLRDRDYFDKLIKMFTSTSGTSCDQVKLSCGKVLEECMFGANQDFVVNKNYVKKIMTVAMKMTKTPDQQRLSLSLMESLFKHSNAVSLRLVILYHNTISTIMRS